MTRSRYLNSLNQIPQLAPSEREILESVTDIFVFRSNEYYQSLINWEDPNDPIRRIIMPDQLEEMDWGELDVSNEDVYTTAPGCQHKYRDTALLLCNDVCGGYCRFCFRKRLFMDDNDETVRDISEGLAYIQQHHEITNVLLTGGDPLIMSTNKLEDIIRRVREIEHVQVIRLGSKIPAFNPYRIVNDPSLIEMLSKYSRDDKKIYMMAHFNHPRELTPVAIKGLNLLQKAGVVTVNQTPLIRGVNDHPSVLSRLFSKLSFIGVPPYYVFQCRPTAGNFTFSTPIEKSIEIFDRARKHCSGLAKRARLTMSHHTGKIEILGKDEEFIYFKYHRASHPKNLERFFSCRLNPNAYWLDDYEEIPIEDELFNPRDNYTAD